MKKRLLTFVVGAVMTVAMLPSLAHAQIFSGTVKIKKPFVSTNSVPTVNPPTGTSWIYTDPTSHKLCSWDSLGNVNCVGGTGGTGITSLNGLTGAAQTFTNDTNVTISSAGTAHAIVWVGTLAKARTLATTVYTDQANTWSTGAQDFGAATSLKIPTGAGLAPTANGNVAYDSTANQYKFGVNGATKIAAFSDSTFPESQITNLTSDLAAKAPLAGPTFTGTTTIPALTLSGITGSIQCLHVSSLGVVSGTGSDCGSGGGSGTINASTQYSVGYYSAVGSATTISGLAAPTSPSNVPQYLISLNSSGTAAAPIWAPAGMGGRTVTTTTDTVAATDRAGWIVYNSASSVATSLPQAGSSGFAGNFVFGVKNANAGAVTITPTTSTIDGNATLVVSEGQNCTITSLDNTNYISRCASGQVTAGSNITITPTANGIQIAASASSGISSPGANGMVACTGTSCSTTAARTIAGTANRIVVTNGDGVAGAPTFDVGTNVNTSTVTPTTKQMAIANAADRTITYIDFPDTKYSPASNNVNGTGGIGWTCPNATPAVLLRAGTNNKDSLLSPWGATDVCYFRVHLPSDYDSTANIGVSIDLTSTDVTNAHTIIMQASSSCAKGDGSTTDDVAFNTAQSFSTITLNANANRTWQATLSALTNTGCAAGGQLWVKISRTTDTATNVGVYGATVTIPRLLTVQAN